MAGQHTFQPAHMADLLPTLGKLAGGTLPDNLDGIDIKPLLTGNRKTADRRVLLWQMDLYKGFQNQGPKPTPYATSVATDGKWKLLTDSLKPTELFNLAQDHRELYNLLGEHPEIEKRLLEALRKYHEALQEGWQQILGPIEQY